MYAIFQTLVQNTSAKHLCRTLIQAMLTKLSIKERLLTDLCYLENLRRYAMKTQLFIHHYGKAEFPYQGF